MQVSGRCVTVRLYAELHAADDGEDHLIHLVILIGTRRTPSKCAPPGARKTDRSAAEFYFRRDTCAALLGLVSKVEPPQLQECLSSHILTIRHVVLDELLDGLRSWVTVK
jgi:hypothetical protein